jgi:glycosyltransferase involved in cell wall biosynthesis
LPDSLEIHHLLDNLNIGGAETLVAALSSNFIQRGHTVVIHALNGRGPLSDRIEARGIRIISHRETPPAGPLRPLQQLLLQKSLYSAFRATHPAVVHCHDGTATILGAPAAKAARVPCIVSTRHSTSTHLARMERKFWFSARFCGKVVAVSESAKESYAKDPWADPSKLVLIDNGADVPSTEREPSAKPVTKAGFTLVSVGRMVPAKNFPSLLEAVAIAAVTVPDLELWIVGDGVGRPRLEAMILELSLQDRVSLLGMRADVGYLVAQADLFVLASVYEGLPVSLLEAMALGIPALVTDVGGMPGVVNAASCGFVVPPSDPHALAGAIVEASRRRLELPSLGQAAHRMYRSRFTLMKTADQYLNLYGVRSIRENT